MIFLPRGDLQRRIERSIKQYPVTLLLGPRQCGKTSIARRIGVQQKAAYFDLEDPQTALQPETAATLLRPMRGLIIVDEFHRQPHLFEMLRVFSDRRPLPSRFLILGSASPDLVRGVSETLAGRISYVEMGGFTFPDVGTKSLNKLWLRGGFPPAFLARSDERSQEWRLNFIQTFLERDIPQLGIRIPAPALRRFWTMLAHVHGYTWNAAELARSMSVKEDTARRYLDILSGAFMIRQLQPWFENTGKRLVKAPKVYFRDTGLLHSLLGILGRNQLLTHPRLGLSWEGFALEQTIRATSMEQNAFFYKTHSGAELDLLLFHRGKKFGIEFKYADAPAITRSMRVVLEDLKLERLWVVYPGDSRYPLADRIEVIPLSRISEMIEAAR